MAQKATRNGHKHQWAFLVARYISRMFSQSLTSLNGIFFCITGFTVPALPHATIRVVLVSELSRIYVQKKLKLQGVDAIEMLAKF